MKKSRKSRQIWENYNNKSISKFKQELTDDTVVRRRQQTIKKCVKKSNFKLNVLAYGRQRQRRHSSAKIPANFKDYGTRCPEYAFPAGSVCKFSMETSCNLVKVKCSLFVLHVYWLT